MSVFLGLDCGGSSCRAVAIDSEGHTLHQGQAGPANIASTPPGKLQNHVIKASREAPAPDYVCGCFAGLLVQEDRRRAEQFLSATFPGAKVRAEPDYFAALMASEGADICVIAGTGSLVCSKHNGVVVKSGGRGFILGDYCSAFQFGRAAMMHFLQVGPNRCSENLAAVIEERFGSVQENEVLARLYRGGLPTAQLAKLASAFAKDVRAGESYTEPVLKEQTSLLAKIVKSHITSYCPHQKELTISLAGGLWDGSSVFKNAFEEQLRQELESVCIELVRIARPPVYGAVELAKELAV